MLIIYRISEEGAGYKKVKPDYINNENCLKNALRVFPEHLYEWLILADNISLNTGDMIREYYKGEIKHLAVGHGAGTFNIALDEALASGEEYFYFIESDYVHLPGASNALYDAFDLGADYVTLYLHPDKFIAPQLGGNPNVDDDGGCFTKIYQGKTELFGLFDSTTMTFGASKQTLIKDEHILRKWTNMGHYPRDFDMFLELKQIGRTLLCPLLTKSTHGETNWLAPLTGFEKHELEEQWGKLI